MSGVLEYNDKLYTLVDSVLWEFNRNDIYSDWKKSEKWPRDIEIVGGELMINTGMVYTLPTKEQHDCHCKPRALFDFGCKCGGK